MMDTNVKVVAWLFILLGLFGLFITSIVFIAIFGGGLISGDRTAISITGLVAVIVCSILLVVAVPGMIAGFGLLKFKPWARILGLVLGILNLPNFPVGTILGIYVLYALLDERISPLFNHPAVIVPPVSTEASE